MKYSGTLMLLLTLACCAGPQPEPVDEAVVFEPGATCRLGHDGGAVVADRGIGGTGVPAKTRTSDRGIGGTGIGITGIASNGIGGTGIGNTGIASNGIGGTGIGNTGVAGTGIGNTGIGNTGIVGVVTGFASICVDGVEVRLDKNVQVSLNGAAASAKQLRVGQLVVIEAGGQDSAAHAAGKAKMIAVRYEVSGPIEAVDTAASAIVVAGQRVLVLPTTWVAGRFAPGTWTTVSGLRQSDGTVVASRLDRGRVGALFVRGQIAREGDTTRIGGLVLRGPWVAFAKTGAFVSITGEYAGGTAEVTSIDADLLAEDPTRYFGIATRQVVVQAFVRVDRGTVWLNNGRGFQAGADVQGRGSFYRNAIVRLERTASGAFIATELHYTAYRSQPADAPVRSKGHGAGDLVLPPDAPPGPPPDVSPADAPDGGNGIEDAPSIAPDTSPGGALISYAALPPGGSSGDRRSGPKRDAIHSAGVLAALE